MPDWGTAITSLLHMGENNIYKGKWEYIKDFEEATWVKSINATYKEPTASVYDSQCIIEFKYTKDRLNWSQWLTISDGIDSESEEKQSEYKINDLIYSINFRITLIDGWDGKKSIAPSVSSLSYTTVTPSVKYLITPEKTNHGMMFEYLLSTTATLPPTTRIRWGIVRGNSTDFEDFDIVKNARTACLPNRQYGIRYTPEIVREDLETETQDYQIYTVLESNGSTALWSDSDEVIVTINDNIISSAAYSLSGTEGKIYFNISYADLQPVITVTITTPSTVISFDGEPTRTNDYRTYYAVNGRWPKDATIIVLVNGNIARGGFWSSSEDGTVTFDHERESTDVISVFVQYSSSYRVGIEITNYDDNRDVSLTNLGLYFTELNNTDLMYKYLNSPVPSLNLLDDSYYVKLNCDNDSIFSRMIVEYDFKSENETRERDTAIRWFKIPNGQEDIPANEIEITAENSLPEYRGRVTERNVDTGLSGLFDPGDVVYVRVTPSDGTIVPIYDPWDENGLKTYESNHVLLLGTGQLPLAWEPQILSASNTTTDLVISSINTATNVFTTNIPHGFSAGDKIGFEATTFPTGILPNTVYYAIPDTSDNTKFQVATSSGGTAIDFSGSGIGLNVYKYHTVIKAGESLIPDFKFYNPDDDADIDGKYCVINWYSKDDTSTVFYTGVGKEASIIPVNMIEAGQIIFFIVTPKSLTITGKDVSSSCIEVIE